MFKKIAVLAAMAAALLPATSMAATYPTVYSSYIGVNIPVACNVIVPQQSFGAISYGLGTDIDADQTVAGGACNVNWTASWSDSNASFHAGSGPSFSGVLKGTDVHGTVQQLGYTLTLCQGLDGATNAANSIAGGTIHIHIPFSQQFEAVGGVNYSDTLFLTVNY